MNEISDEIRARFWGKVAPADERGCRVWLGARERPSGKPPRYGSFGFMGKVQKAHRVVWWLTHGDPGPRCVLHKCDNVACVEPSHLFLGTQHDNINDMVKKKRQRSTTRATSPLSKITEAQIEEARAKVKAGCLVKDLAPAYDVHWSTLYRVLRKPPLPRR